MHDAGDAAAGIPDVNLAAPELKIGAAIVGGGAKLTRAALGAARMIENAAKGKKGESITRANLGRKSAGEQVTFKTNDNTRTRADFVTTDKAVVETKAGKAELSTGQQKLHDDINAGRTVTPVGKNAEKAGLQSGQPTTMSGCSFDRPC